MKRYLIFIGVVCAFLSSCGKSELEPKNDVSGTKLFYAEVPSGDTKTYIDGDYELHWTADDRISVFCSPTNEQYKFTGGTGAQKGAFENLTEPATPTYGHNYAVYPYQPTNSSSVEGTITVTLPSVQTYAEKSFGLGANAMLAVTQDISDDRFRFKNVCGYLMLKLYGGDRIKSITLRGNGGEKIAGAATITAGYDANPAIAMSETATTEITLECPEEGVPTNESEESFTQFWIAVPPITFTGGFTIEITNTSDNIISRSTSSNVTIHRNKILKMAPVKVDTQNAHELLSFSLSDGVHSYEAFDISDGYVNVHVPNGTDMTNMTATFTYNGESVKVNDIPQTSGADSHDFSDFVNPITYVVTSKAGASQSYIIRMFNLPIAIIRTPNEKKITSKTVWTEGCTFQIIEDNGDVSDYGNETQVRGRGNSTWSHPKKPYTIKLKSNEKVLGMPKEKRWNLLANYVDRTIIRNAVALEIARRTESLGWSSHGNFVELILNGAYLGTYYLCEHNKISTNRVNIVKMDKSDVSPETITGGYLIEYDMYVDSDQYFISDICKYRVKFKDPDDSGYEQQWTWIQNFINNLEECLSDDTKLYSQEYTQLLDTDSFIDWWFVYEITGNGPEPKVPHSSYMNKDRNGKLKAGPVWDFDSYTFRRGLHGFQLKDALYYKYLFKDPHFIHRVKQKWPVFKSNLNSIPDYIDQQVLYVANAAARNGQMWPTIDRNYDNLLSVPEASARLKSVFEARVEEFETLINSLVVDYDTKPGGNEDVDNQQDESGDFDFNF